MNTKGFGAWRFPEDVVAYFQPEYSINQQKIVGIEALARMRDASGQIIPPDAFIPFLDMEQRRELSRLMLVAGLQVLELLDAQGIVLNLSFNVDPDFMVEHDCAICFTGTMTNSPVAPSRVCLELLESGDFLNRHIAKDRLQALRDTGVRLALDDVGSAYSSLLRMKELPIDKIKLDQEFIRDLGAQPKNLAFVQSIQLLANALNAELVIEGVETLPILDAMRALHLDFIQGYAVARPMPAHELMAMVIQGYDLPEGSAKHPASLLGAYAAHLLRRPLMAALRRGWIDVSVTAPPPCPLIAFLREHGAAEDHPIVAAHHRLVSVKSDPEQGYLDQTLNHIETEIQELVREAIDLEQRE
jgi:FOG: EAL domain